MDAVTAIVNDHRLLEELFEQLRADRENRTALLAEVAARLLAHQRAEEKHLYPALRTNRGKAAATHPDDSGLRAAQERFAALAADLHRVQVPATPGSGTGHPERPAGPQDGFAAALDELVCAVRQHVAAVESEALPTLTANLSTRKREDLGRKFDGLRLRELKRAGIDDTLTKEDLYIRAQKAGIPGRSSMSKGELARALLVAGRTGGSR
ncbi:MAG TPA: hemerythrin domain-containing protein [Actinophytocola sp.]|uniref:hemerythrin domain-containing protein n=1 Tax=Actinophytocola sp. TaxID=1872138 RepID=UPI002DBAA970|nr:hemerythrin domain-containing protein [Actinophytocola sp.]HEU5471747.1 hemerythrin domain-containing protein [Actinophytocola sp.]